MNNDLTINGRSFTSRYSDKDTGSVRADSSRGATLPTTLTIKHKKVKEGSDTIQRSMLRIDRVVDLGTSGLKTVSAYCVVTYPANAVVNNADITAALADVTKCLNASSVDSGLGLITPVFLNQEQ